MRFRRALIVVTAGAALSAALPAAADPEYPQIVDQANDANGVNGQWHEAAFIGQVVWIVYQVAFGGDPAGQGQQAPVSYAPADLRASWFETEYVAVPVGEDGIDYQATGIRWTVRTEEPAIAQTGQASDLSFTVIGELHAPDRSACTTSFRMDVGPDGEVRPYVGWYRFEDCSTGLASGVIPGWAAARGEDPRTIVARMPVSALDETAAGYFAEGATITYERAVSRASVFTYDVTRVGNPFVVGEDMPLDVPCTRGCP